MPDPGPLDLKHIRWALTQALKRVRHLPHEHAHVRENVCRDCKEIKRLKEALATMTDEAIDKLTT